MERIAELITTPEVSYAFWRVPYRAVQVTAYTGVACVTFALRFALRRSVRLRWREESGLAMAALCERLGPAFIKAAQVVSARPDLLTPEFARGLARLQDRVEPMSQAELSAVLREAYRAEPNEVFREFDPVPIAAASISQVHRAIGRYGETLAIKVKRPGVGECMALDVAAIRWLAKVASRTPGMSSLPVEELAEEILAPVLQQLDFFRERANNRRFRANLRNAGQIRIPKIADEYSTESTIAMEFVDGFIKAPAVELSAVERRDAALAGLRALYHMIFVDGFVHADLHPGNLGFCRNGILVLLDTGLVAELEAQDRLEFVEFFFGMVNNDGKLCARILRKQASAVSSSFQEDRFEADMCSLIAKHSALKSAEFQIAVFVAEMLSVQRRHGMRGSPKFIMTVLSMAIYDGICKQLYPQCDFQKEARPYLVLGWYGGAPRAKVRI
ncbi:hypothetical protein F183_A28290 [Bryobacterales bacterium F-183]|nr:hypothetical protein F183_A28290 [Bryobacterales bacterium F-183]